MPLRLPFRTLGLVMALALPAPAAAQQVFADLVLVGGKVFLADRAGTTTSALAVRDGRVLLAGTDAQVRALAGPATRVVELRGRLVTPGFNDAHLHLPSGGGFLQSVNLLDTRSPAEVERRVAEAAARSAPGEWIIGRGRDQTRWTGAALGPGGSPTRDVLDRAAPRNPVVLSRVDGHTSWVNSLALAAAGIDRGTPDPQGGKIVRDPATGEATGILQEDAARDLVVNQVPPPTAAQIRRGLRSAMELAARVGVTSAASDITPIVAGSGSNDSPALPAAFRVLQEMERADSLTIRLSLWFPLDRALIEAYRRLGVTAGFGSEWLRLGMLKGYTDGSLGSRSAYLLEPYSDAAHTRGLPQYRQGQLDSLVAEADAAGLQVLLHGIGDAAVRQALDAFEAAARANGPRERRHRVEHAQVVDAADLPRFRALGVIASMQPTHATSDMRWAEARLGHARAVEGAYAWRALLDAGATVVFGTDFPVEPMAPVEGIYSAVTRQSREEPGTPPGGWLPEQRVSRAEAIRLYTATPAFAEWEEDRKGTLQAGMLADLVVWSADLLTIPEVEILSARPDLTIVGGRVVFSR